MTEIERLRRAVRDATAEKVLDMAMATLAEIDRRLHSMKQPVVMPGSVEYEPVQPEPVRQAAGYPSEPSISDGRGMTPAGSPSVTSEPVLSEGRTPEWREGAGNEWRNTITPGSPSDDPDAGLLDDWQAAYEREKARADAAEAARDAFAQDISGLRAAYDELQLHRAHAEAEIAKLREEREALERLVDRLLTPKGQDS